MSDEETKYYVNITKERLEGLDNVNIELNGDDDKISIVSSDDYTTLATELETITTNAQTWVANQIRTTIQDLTEGAYDVPYSTNSGGLKDKTNNTTISYNEVANVVDNFEGTIKRDTTDTLSDDSTINAIANIIYPVGSIYMSANDVNPSVLFGGGTWEKIEGKFLLSSYGSTYTLGSTGGEANHTLTVDEMPSHTHIQNEHTHTQNAHNHSQNSHNHTQNSHYHAMTGNKTCGLQSGSYLRVGSIRSSEGSKNTNSTTATNKATTATNNSATATNKNATATNQNTGKGYAHNNMPPYIVVHMWKRTL